MVRRQRTMTRNKAWRYAQHLGCTRADFDRAEADLQRTLGAAIPGDVFWRLADEKFRVASLARDWRALKLIDFNRALFLHDEGKEWRPLREESERSAIREYIARANDSGIIVGVAISSGACCPACDQMDGMAYSFEKALEELPIPQVCEGDWCRCNWTTILAA